MKQTVETHRSDSFRSNFKVGRKCCTMIEQIPINKYGLILNVMGVQLTILQRRQNCRDQVGRRERNGIMAAVLLDEKWRCITSTNDTCVCASCCFGTTSGGGGSGIGERVRARLAAVFVYIYNIIVFVWYYFYTSGKYTSGLASLVCVRVRVRACVSVSVSV